MRFGRGLFALLAIGIVCGRVTAQSLEQTSFLFRRPAPADCAAPASGPMTVVPPDASAKDQTSPENSQAFAQAPSAGGEGGLSFNPAMFGDLGAGIFGLIYVRTFIVIPPTTITVPGPPSDSGPTTITKIIPGSVIEKITAMRVPVIGAGSFKIADNESPRPSDRVFFTYNYYSDVNAGGTGFGLNREVFGFEKTFLGGDASFGMRLPLLQTTLGSDLGSFPDHEIGDLTLISKFALIDNPANGNILSAGLALTVPTADHSLVLVDGTPLRSVLFQPYGAWIVNAGRLYAQGFHSLVAPTDNRDITEINNDVGVGYWAYKGPGGFLRGIVPTFEAHVYTPLNHRANTDLIYASDICTLTAGVNFVMPGFTTLGIAIAAPVTGPRPDNVEAIVSFNLRF